MDSLFLLSFVGLSPYGLLMESIWNPCSFFIDGLFPYGLHMEGISFGFYLNRVVIIFPS